MPQSSSRIGFFLLALGLCLSPAPSVAQSSPAQTRLSAILGKSADYCRKLDNAALDFVCMEEVTETSYNLAPDTDVYLYDYQFVRKAGGARERRDLVAVNGKKKDSKDVPLRPGHFQYENVLFGPIGLLSRYWQTFLAYRIVGDDLLYGQKAVIVEAVPGAGLIEAHPYGRIWISEKDGSVLKIVWDQRSLGNFKAAEEWATEHDAEPMFTAYSEYGFEKNGLRFPSRSYTEQAYMRKDRGKSPIAEISVTYMDYKFFTVETETIY